MVTKTPTSNKPTKHQREQARFKARYPNLSQPPTTSTVRRWRKRCISLVSAEDWESALLHASSFEEIKTQIQSIERAHREWKKQGVLWYQTTHDIPHAPDGWGESWGFYH